MPPQNICRTRAGQQKIPGESLPLGQITKSAVPPSLALPRPLTLTYQHMRFPDNGQSPRRRLLRPTALSFRPQQSIHPMPSYRASTIGGSLKIGHSAYSSALPVYVSYLSTKILRCQPHRQIFLSVSQNKSVCRSFRCRGGRERRGRAGQFARNAARHRPRRALASEAPASARADPRMRMVSCYGAPGLSSQILTDLYARGTRSSCWPNYGYTAPPPVLPEITRGNVGAFDRLWNAGVREEVCTVDGSPTLIGVTVSQHQPAHVHL